MSARSGLVGKNPPGPIWAHLGPFFAWAGKIKLVRSPDPQPREVRIEKCCVNPVVSFRYIVGYSLSYGLTLFLALCLKAAINSKTSTHRSQKRGVQTHSLVRCLCDSSPCSAHDELCWNRYQRNMFCQMTPTYYLKPGE